MLRLPTSSLLLDRYLHRGVRDWVKTMSKTKRSPNEVAYVKAVFCLNIHTRYLLSTPIAYKIWNKPFVFIKVISLKMKMLAKSIPYYQLWEKKLRIQTLRKNQTFFPLCDVIFKHMPYYWCKIHGTKLKYCCRTRLK